jgi:hypothetical protein
MLEQANTPMTALRRPARIWFFQTDTIGEDPSNEARVERTEAIDENNQTHVDPVKRAHEKRTAM